MQPHVLSFETTNEHAIQELTSLAHRLGIKVSDMPAPSRQADVARRAALFRSLFGAWQSEESGEELNRQLMEARQTSSLDIEL